MSLMVGMEQEDIIPKLLAHLNEITLKLITLIVFEIVYNFYFFRANLFVRFVLIVF